MPNLFSKNIVLNCRLPFVDRTPPWTDRFGVTISWGKFPDIFVE